MSKASDIDLDTLGKEKMSDTDVARSIKLLRAIADIVDENDIDSEKEINESLQQTVDTLENAHYNAVKMQEAWNKSKSIPNE
jgi:hypothetical protein